MSAARRRSAAVVGVYGAVVGVAAGVVVILVGQPWLFGAIVAVAVGAMVALAMLRAAWPVLLRLTGGTEPRGPHKEVLENVLEGLCVNHGIPVPELRVIGSDAVNALAAARTPDQATIVVTSGAVDHLDRIELEGLLAHHLCRIRRGDAAFETLAGVLLAWPLGAVGRLRSRLMERALPAGTSLEADFEAVSLTRYPPGLLSTLVTLSGHPARVPSPTVAALHMWIHEPDWGFTDLVRHPPLQTRIDALREL